MKGSSWIIGHKREHFIYLSGSIECVLKRVLEKHIIKSVANIWRAEEQRVTHTASIPVAQIIVLIKYVLGVALAEN